MATSRKAATKKAAKKGKEKEADAVDPAFALVVRTFARDRDVSYGKMFASKGLKVNGKIFAMHTKGKFVAKLPQPRVAELVRLGTGAYFDPGHGRLMKEWVAIAGNEASWVGLAKEARRFVGGLN